MIIYGAFVHNCINVFDETYTMQKRYYFHNWIELDIETKQVTKFSKPFLFKSFDIEFASGIYKDNANTITVYFGKNDKESYTLQCDLGIFDAL